MRKMIVHAVISRGTVSTYSVQAAFSPDGVNRTPSSAPNQYPTPRPFHVDHPPHPAPQHPRWPGRTKPSPIMTTSG
jgi:hypothetical protein